MCRFHAHYKHSGTTGRKQFSSTQQHLVNHVGNAEAWHSLLTSLFKRIPTLRWHALPHRPGT
jgi:hypothetical protein